MRVHFLDDRERQGTRAFYESAFPEDSQEFVDFYYEWVVKWNDIFVADQWEEDAYKIQAMVHINRHGFSVNGLHRAAPYFVAVATRPDCRKQGKMHYLIEKALQDMHRRHYSFAFLMPANPAYYTGLGFRYFPNQPGLWRSNIREIQNQGVNLGAGAQPGDSQLSSYGSAWPVKNQSSIQDDIGQMELLADKSQAAGVAGTDLTDAQSGFWQGVQWRQSQQQDIPQMCMFANQALGRDYQIFIRWDEDYCKRLFAETAAEQGGILLLELDNVLQGILVYGISSEKGGEKTAEVKDFILDESLMLYLQCQMEGHSAEICKRRIQEMLCHAALPGCAIAFPPMEMMVRILSIGAFVPLLKSMEYKVLSVEIEDPIIPANCGCFEIILAPEGNRINPILPTGNEEKMDIAEVAQFLLKDVPVNITEWV